MYINFTCTTTPLFRIEFVTFAFLSICYYLQSQSWTASTTNRFFFLDPFELVQNLIHQDMRTVETHRSSSSIWPHHKIVPRLCAQRHHTGGSVGCFSHPPQPPLHITCQQFIHPLYTPSFPGFRTVTSKTHHTNRLRFLFPLRPARSRENTPKGFNSRKQNKPPRRNQHRFRRMGERKANGKCFARY